MTKTNEKKFLYNDVTERFKLMNQFYIFSTTEMWALFLLFMWMKLAVRSIAQCSVAVMVWQMLSVKMVQQASTLSPTWHSSRASRE